MGSALSTKPYAPSRTAWTQRSKLPVPVYTITGTSMPRCFRRRNTSKPSVSRHLEVENDAVDRLAGEHLQRLIATRRDGRAVAPHALQVVGILLGHRRDVIDDQHLYRHVRIAPLAGRSMLICVPWPGALSTRTLPSRSITSRRTIESPRPVPLALVV